MVEVSILLLTKNGCSDLSRVLPAVFRQAAAMSFEVIAIDSGSTDGTLELLREFPVRILYIPPEQFHHARTRNFAASHAQGNILTFLSQDAVPASDDWLAALVANFEDPQVGAVYGRQFPKPGSSSERRNVFDAIYGDKRTVKDPSCRNEMGYRFYHFSDVNAAIRRSVWEKTLFPEDLKVFEDLAIAKRILDDGWKIVYEPEAAVFHSHTHTTLQLFKRYFDIGYTLKRLRIWDAPGTRKSLLRDGWRMLRRSNASVYSAKSGHPPGKAIGQHIAKSAGLFLGLNQEHLPLALKRHFSAFRLFG